MVERVRARCPIVAASCIRLSTGILGHTRELKHSFLGAYATLLVRQAFKVCQLEDVLVRRALADRGVSVEWPTVGYGTTKRERRSSNLIHYPHR